jgi:hypothetical protein
MALNDENDHDRRVNDKRGSVNPQRREEFSQVPRFGPCRSELPEIPE